MDLEIGAAKRGRRAYAFDDVAIVPSRRTRDPGEVSTAWQIDAYRFDLPVVAFQQLDGIDCRCRGIAGRVTGTTGRNTLAAAAGCNSWSGHGSPSHYDDACMVRPACASGLPDSSALRVPRPPTRM